MPFDYSAFPTLKTDRLVLRELSCADTEDLFSFRSDPVEQMYNTSPVKDLPETRALIEELRTAYEKERAIHWAVTLKDEDRAIGLFGFNYWERFHRRAEIGYDLALPFHGRGLATEAAAAMVRFGFEEMELNRIETETIADNHASVRLLRRLGFRLEGIRRGYSLEDDGTFHGSAIYALLREEYQP
ncbi:GNAT family N-acetyltransferase [Actinopolymorpha pittospori]